MTIDFKIFDTFFLVNIVDGYEFAIAYRPITNN